MHAKPLKGFTGADVLDLVEDHDDDTYRAVYTVKLRGRVYVLASLPPAVLDPSEQARNDSRSCNVAINFAAK